MFEKIFEQIKAADVITIHGHTSPDGDCYGSQIGLRESLKLVFPNKKIFAVGSGLPEFFFLIGEMDDPTDDEVSSSLAVVLDGNDLDRMEDKRVKTAKAFVKIDHHIDMDTFTQGEQVVDPDANSTCDLVFRFLEESKLPIDDNVASALYLGILTDTNRFKFAEDHVQMFEDVAKIAKYGAKTKQILDTLIRIDERTLKFKGYYLTHYQKSPGHVIYIILTKEILAEYNVSVNEISTMINLLGNIKGYPLWFAFLEYPDGRVRCEFRSKKIDVQSIATSIGGGGHLYASGATIKSLDMNLINNVIKLADMQCK